MKLNATRLCMIALAGVYLGAAVGYTVSGELLKSGMMLGCGVLFVINLARYIDAGV